jgi:putative aminopeptidase FrvX
MEKGRLEFLREYMGTICPTGFEAEAGRVWRAEAERFADRTWSDVMGNVAALINEGGSPRIMLAGHTDEIGLQVTYVNDDGFLFFQTLGGWDPQILPGQRVRIRTREGTVLGVVGRKAIHVMDADETKKGAKIEDLWIDIGASDKKDALSAVSLGDAGVIDYGFVPLRGDIVAARAFDDRIGAFVVLEALRKVSKMKPKAAIYAVATSQEEIGSRGAGTSTFGIDPAVGIAVDVGQATDMPDMDKAKKKYGECKLGGGPQITRGPNINPALYARFVETAEGEGIPYQIELCARTTPTDAAPMQVSRGGVAAGLISIPTRYMHSPGELIHLDDVENAAKLIAHTIAGINDETSFLPE